MQQFAEAVLEFVQVAQSALEVLLHLTSQADVHAKYFLNATLAMAVCPSTGQLFPAQLFTFIALCLLCWCFRRRSNILSNPNIVCHHLYGISNACVISPHAAQIHPHPMSIHLIDFQMQDDLWWNI